MACSIVEEAGLVARETQALGRELSVILQGTLSSYRPRVCLETHLGARRGRADSEIPPDKEADASVRKSGDHCARE